MDIVAIVGLIVAIIAIIVAMVMGLKTHRTLKALPATIYEFNRDQWVIPHLAAEGGPPPLPHAFYGIVKINGQPAPVATEVKARGENARTGIEGNPIMLTEAGRYGGPGNLDPKLVVQGNIEEGTTLTFYVNDVCAEERVAWHSGKVTQLNLTVRP